MATMTMKDIIITRAFDSPRELVWKAWTDPKHFARWWGPKGFTAPHISIDFRVAGKFLYCMRGPGLDGVTRDFWNTGVYLEISPMEKIVYTDGFANEKGKRVAASYYGMPGDWPGELTVTVTFEKRDGKTMMTLRHAGIPEEMIEQCEEGWNESFDKLAKSLK
jgi:uncharacterized protein YndB with AHSA1/START domain